MTLPEATAVLNAHAHNGRADWAAEQRREGVFVTVSGAEWRDYILVPFEAIAIAERYEAGYTPENDAAASAQP